MDILLRRDPSKEPFKKFVFALRADYGDIAEALEKRHNELLNTGGQFMNNVKCLHCSITEGLIPRDVADNLYQESILTYDELIMLTNPHRSKRKRNGKLIKILHACHDPRRAAQVLVCALTHSFLRDQLGQLNSVRELPVACSCEATRPKAVYTAREESRHRSSSNNNESEPASTAEYNYHYHVVVNRPEAEAVLAADGHDHTAAQYLALPNHVATLFGLLFHLEGAVAKIRRTSLRILLTVKRRHIAAQN